MVEKVKADASPEKRLFVSLITRDIPLIAAFLDLIDNSINSVVEPVSDQLSTAQDYNRVLVDDSIIPSVDIKLTVDPKKVKIEDSASGISLGTAQEHVFKFGRSSDEAHTHDRLSVYGIGLKRAIFKLGNLVTIKSDHEEGGFDLSLDVKKWEKITGQSWTFDITSRDPVSAEETGTVVEVEQLYDDAKRRISDGVFLGQLKEVVARTYAFYLAKFVNIYINEEKINGVNIEIGDNSAADVFSREDVSCAVTAGIGIPQGGKFRERSSGWFVFCNGRTVLSADRTQLTGWGTGAAGLPIYQPKHRAFIGTVFFVSKDPEKLPWTTTKSGINVDSAIWQEAKRHMAAVGREVVSFLDSRYTDEGTEVPITDLEEAAGKRMSVISALVTSRRAFSPPKSPKVETVRIQYQAKVTDVKLIADYLGRSAMSGAEIGRYTFEYFLRNEVGEK